MRLFDPDDIHGRATLPESAALVDTAKVRRINHGRQGFHYPYPNGAHDPLTFWHILDHLLQARADEMFLTRELVASLRTAKTGWSWDSVTVGRVITDMAESLEDANGRQAINYVRRWDGMHFSVSALGEDRAALERLLDDLTTICETSVANAQLRVPNVKTDSPMLRCPSVMDPLRNHTHERAIEEAEAVLAGEYRM